jgi:AcrR family transcriptional regulator
VNTEAGKGSLAPVISPADRAAGRSPFLQQRRSRNIEQMKNMVEAAKRLISQQGSGFTAQELAREAGVAVQTFYRHFGGKDQLLLAVLEELMATHAAEGAAAARGLPDPLARLRFYVMGALAALDDAHQVPGLPQFITMEHWRLYQLFPQEVALATQPITDLFAREIQAAQDQGLIAPSDVTAGAELMVILVRTVFHQYAFARKNEPAATIAERVWGFCLQGIGGPLSGSWSGN